jgi:hypothetical protein
VSCNARRDPHRSGTFCGVVGHQEFVGESACGATVAGQRERIGEPRVERGRADFRGGAVQPGGLTGVGPVARGEIGERIGELRVAQPVVGQLRARSIDSVDFSIWVRTSATSMS